MSIDVPPPLPSVQTPAAAATPADTATGILWSSNNKKVLLSIELRRFLSCLSAVHHARQDIHRVLWRQQLIGCGKFNNNFHSARSIWLVLLEGEAEVRINCHGVRQCCYFMSCGTRLFHLFFTNCKLVASTKVSCFGNIYYVCDRIIQ